MKKISAEIVADSLSPQGHRIITFLLHSRNKFCIFVEKNKCGI